MERTDASHVGVLEGAFRAHRLEPEIRIRMGSRRCDADFDLRWR
jgi:hypothetical protein